MFLKTLQKTLIVFVLIGQLLAQGFYLPFLKVTPLYLILLTLLGVVAIIDWGISSRFSIKFKALNGIPVIFLLTIANIIFSLLVNVNFDGSRVILVITSITFCLACYNVIKTERDVRFFLSVYVAIVLVSAICAIGQYLGISLFYDLWSALHNSNKLSQSIRDLRFLGMASDTLQLSYHISAAFAVVLFYKFKLFNLFKKAVISAVLLFGLYVNDTRSGFIVIAVIIIFWILSKKSSYDSSWLPFYKAIAIVGIIAVLSIYIAGRASLENTRFENLEEDVSAQARLPMFLTAFNHALHYPFGLGAYKVQSQFIVGADVTTYSYVLNNTAHNFLGNCVASYGFIGLILMLTLYGKMIGIYRKTSRGDRCFWVYRAAFVALIGLAINSLFHNAYILNGELSSFLFFGIMLSSLKTQKPKTIDKSE